MIRYRIKDREGEVGGLLEGENKEQNRRAGKKRETMSPCYFRWMYKQVYPVPLIKTGDVIYTGKSKYGSFDTLRGTLTNFLSFLPFVTRSSLTCFNVLP